MSHGPSPMLSPFYVAQWETCHYLRRDFMIQNIKTSKHPNTQILPLNELEITLWRIGIYSHSIKEGSK